MDATKGTLFLAVAILVFSIFVFPIQYANAIIDVSGDATIPKETTKELRLVVKLLKTASSLESKDKLDGTEVSIPVTLVIPIDVEGENTQICVALLSSGAMTCQQIIVKDDQVSVAPNTTTSKGSSTNETDTGDAREELKFVIKLLKTVARTDSDITSITIPITFIVPIDVDSETSQICLSILSSGEMNCQQIMINENNQTASMAPAAQNDTVAPSTLDNDTATSENSTVIENETDNGTTDDNDTAKSDDDANDTDSDEPCITPCPPEQYCIQMCQPEDNATAGG